MATLDFLTAVLAQAAAPAGKAAEPPMWVSYAPMIGIVVLFFLVMVLPQKREQKKRQQMLDAMKKNDRVLTIGGMIGTVANISSDGKEVTLKVDDNTRIRFRRSSIAEILGAESDGSNS